MATDNADSRIMEPAANVTGSRGINAGVGIGQENHLAAECPNGAVDDGCLAAPLGVLEKPDAAMLIATDDTGSGIAAAVRSDHDFHLLRRIIGHQSVFQALLDGGLFVMSNDKQR